MDDKCEYCEHSWHGLMCEVTKTSYSDDGIKIYEKCKCGSQFKAKVSA